MHTIDTIKSVFTDCRADGVCVIPTELTEQIFLDWLNAAELTHDVNDLTHWHTNCNEFLHNYGFDPMELLVYI